MTHLEEIDGAGLVRAALSEPVAPYVPPTLPPALPLFRAGEATEDVVLQRAE